MRPFLFLFGASALIPFTASAQTAPLPNSDTPPKPEASSSTPPAASPAPPSVNAGPPTTSAPQDQAIVVTGRRLDIARWWLDHHPEWTETR